MNKKKVEQIFSRFKDNNPNPTTELNYNTSFELLIAVILSAQATDTGVNKATKILFAKANTPKAILTLGIDTLKKYINSIGLYNTKAANVIKTCEILVDQYKGRVPTTRKELEALPGVGRKTANVILNTVFKQPTIAVDTHIFRVAKRIGLADGKNVREVEDQLEKIIPKNYLLNAHHWLVLHGRYVCIARKPHCPTCIINDLCDYKDKTPPKPTPRTSN